MSLWRVLCYSMQGEITRPAVMTICQMMRLLVMSLTGLSTDDAGGVKKEDVRNTDIYYKGVRRRIIRNRYLNSRHLLIRLWSMKVLHMVSPQEDGDVI